MHPMWALSTCRWAGGIKKVTHTCFLFYGAFGGQLEAGRAAKVIQAGATASIKQNNTKQNKHAMLASAAWVNDG